MRRMAKFWNAGEGGAGYWDDDGKDIINPYVIQDATGLDAYGSSVGESIYDLEPPPVAPYIAPAPAGAGAYVDTVVNKFVPVPKVEEPVVTWGLPSLPAAGEFPFGTFGGVVTKPDPLPQPDVGIEFKVFDDDFGYWKPIPPVDAPEGTSYGGATPKNEESGGGFLGGMFDFMNDAINPLAWFDVDPVRSTTAGVGGVTGILQTATMLPIIMLMLMSGRDD